MLAGDAMSYRVLVTDLAEAYRGATLPTPGYSYRRYRTERAQSNEAARERDRQWWQQRLPELPGAPELPTDARRGNAPRRTAPSGTTTGWRRKPRRRLVAGAHARGVTPAMALAAVFADTIGGWSAQDRFLLNVPLFHREPVHPDIDRVIGDFTSSIMLEVDVSENMSVADRARAIQRSMYESGSHAAYSGLEVLRDLGRHRGEPVLAPVVFTSALDLGELFADNVIETFGEPVWIISQGPQVLLDAQVTELRGGLLINWDVRESAFPQGMVDAMFARFTEAVAAPRRGRGGLGRRGGGAIAMRAGDGTRGDQRHRRPGQRTVPAPGLLRARRGRIRMTPAVVWGLGETAGRVELPATGASSSLAVAGALRSQGVRTGRRGRGPVTQGARIKSWPCSEFSPPERPMCRSDSTSRMRAARGFCRPRTLSRR